MTNLKEEVALGLFEISAIKFGAFKLKLHEEHPEAPLSPFYIDLRIVRSFPELMDSVTNLYLELLSEYHFDLLVDIPTAATPFVSLISYKSKIPMISPRPEAKGHGIISQIEGIFKRGQKVAIVDDVVTLAESKLSVIEILERNGLLIQCVVVLVDREQGGVEVIQRKGYPCVCALKIRELISFYRQKGRISDEDYNRSMIYLTMSESQVL
jgi:uridine monophosphate synthetase